MNRIDRWIRIALVSAAGGGGLSSAFGYNPLAGAIVGALVGTVANLTGVLAKK